MVFCSKKFLGYLKAALYVCILLLLFYSLSVNKRYGELGRAITSPLNYQYRGDLPLVTIKVLRANLGGLSLFVIDYDVLKALLDEEETELLIKNRMIPTTNSTESRTLQLGIFREKLIPNFCLELRNVLTEYDCQEVTSNENLFHSFDRQVTTKDRLSHFILKSNRLYIHIAVFSRRDNFLWIDSLPDQFDRHLKERINYFGANGTELYDTFESIQCTVSLQNVPFKLLIPNEIGHFISQIRTSYYIACDHNMAKKFPTSDMSQSNFAELAKVGIQNHKVLAKELRVSIWLLSGTLLGWYRQCDIIPYTKDIDFATWAIYATDSFQSEVQDALAYTGNRLSLFCRFGHPDLGYQLVFELDGTHFDWFFNYELPDNTETCYGHISRKRIYFTYTFPKTELCSGVLLGEKVLVPCDPIPYIAAEYGPNWTQPVKDEDWSYATTAFNSGPYLHWPDDETDVYWQKSYFCSIFNCRW